MKFWWLMIYVFFYVIQVSKFYWLLKNKHLSWLTPYWSWLKSAIINARRLETNSNMALKWFPLESSDWWAHTPTVFVFILLELHMQLFQPELPGFVVTCELRNRVMRPYVHSCTFGSYSVCICILFFLSSCALQVCARIVVVLWGATNSGLDLVTETRCLGSLSAEQCPLRTGGNTPAVAVVLLEEGSRRWSAWAPSRCQDPFLTFYNDLILMIIHPKIMNIPIKVNAKMAVYRFW